MPAIPAWLQLLAQVLLYIFQLLSNKQAQTIAAESIKKKRAKCKKEIAGHKRTIIQH